MLQHGRGQYFRRFCDGDFTNQSGEQGDGIIPADYLAQAARWHIPPADSTFHEFGGLVGKRYCGMVGIPPHCWGEVMSAGKRAPGYLAVVGADKIGRAAD